MLKKKLVVAAACASMALLGTGIASADPAPAPDPNGPKCVGYGGDDGTKFQLTPCGWKYGDQRGWYQVDPDGPQMIDGK